MMRNSLVILFLCALVGCGEDATAPSDVSDSSEAKSTRAVQATCDKAINPGIDCSCVDRMIDQTLSKSSYEELFRPGQDGTPDVSQQSIDALIQVALVADDVCSKSD